MENKHFRGVLENTNSILWFFMDSAWVFGWNPGVYALAPLVVITGIFSIVFGDKRADIFCSSLSLNFWILMNVFWAIGDLETMPVLLVISKVFFILGAIFIFLTLMLTGNLRKTASMFKRFRMK